MQSIQAFPVQQVPEYPRAADIPKLTHTEAGQLALVELTRFIALLELLDAADWQRPTMCTAWNVRDILAHQAGAYASSASLAEFRRQVIGNPYIKEAAMSVDGINRRQLEDRSDRSPQALLNELRDVGPRAIANRQKLPGILRALPIPFGPPLGTAPLQYLMDDIYLRDTWMHRCDVCVAVGREMVLTPAHDGRITALIVRDLERILRPLVHGGGVVLELTGPAGGAWRLGQDAAVTITLDAIDFHILASDRATAVALLADGKIRLSGDADLARYVLEHVSVPY